MIHWMTAWMLLLLFTLASCILKASSKLAENNVCPPLCACKSSQPGQTFIICTVSSKISWTNTCEKLRDQATAFQAINLKILGKSSSFSNELSCLPLLESLDLSGTNLYISQNTFHDLQVTSFLNLSYNGINYLPEDVFSGLPYLTGLDLSNNNLSTLTSNLFLNFTSLKFLNLAFNALNASCIRSFSTLSLLELLDLQGNQLTELSVVQLPSSIKTLNLCSNALTTIYIEKQLNGSVVPLQNLMSLDLSENPLECSCYLQKFLYLVPNLKNILKNTAKTACSSPQTLAGKNLQNVNVSDLPCIAPRNIMSYPSGHRNILGFSSITLECQAEGYPKPSIMWITPWNDVFFNKSKLQLPSTGLQFFSQEELFTFREYQEPNVFLISSLLLNSNDELTVTNFRGSFSGNFTCIAINAAGNISNFITLSVYSVMKSVYTQSVLTGSYCATGFLLIGFFVGFVKMAVVWLRQKFYFIVPIFSKSPSAHNPEDTVSNTSFEAVPSKPDSDGSNSQSGTAASHSPLVCQKEFENIEPTDITEEEIDANCSASKRPYYGILESLEDAKGRLRYGVERKMERVRKNVQSIKESSSVYMHTIVETGNSAANRMKAGMVIGVETVKYHVQSFKELCGTGDMGMQTISMVSVETDVDSHQQKEIIKQITYV